MTSANSAPTSAQEKKSLGFLFRRGPLIYLACSFVFSWVFWILAYLLARNTDGDILFNEGLVRGILFNGAVGTPVFVFSIISSIGVYGPLLGGIIATAVEKGTGLRDLGRRIFKIKLEPRWYLSALAILFSVWLIPFLFLCITNGFQFQSSLTFAQILLFLLVFLVMQIFTSGLEEVGWRGYLLEKTLPRYNIWDSGWIVGIIWAIWHFPVVIIMFLQQNMQVVPIVGSLIGFSMGIIAMAILQTWFYKNTRSVFLSILIHASFNTLPLTTGMLFGNAYLAAVATQLLLWVVVIFLMRKAEKKSSLPSS